MLGDAPLISILLKTEEDTESLARKLAGVAAAGDVVLLEGPIGAGKTHFARALIQSLLRIPEDIPSPTFTLVQTYDAPDFEVWHADLYRLSHPDEVIELGLIAAFETALCLVEWPDRLGDLAPENALRLTFSYDQAENARQLRITCRDPRWQTLLQDIDTDG